MQKVFSVEPPHMEWCSIYPPVVASCHFFACMLSSLACSRFSYSRCSYITPCFAGCTNAVMLKPQISCSFPSMSGGRASVAVSVPCVIAATPAHLKSQPQRRESGGE